MEKKLKNAWLIGSVYFVLLGVINFSATLWNGKLGTLDLLILLMFVLPLLINKKTFSLLFGIIAGLISLYMGFAAFMFNLTPNIETSQTAFIMGYLFIAATLSACILLLYSSGSSSQKTIAA